MKKFISLILSVGVLVVTLSFNAVPACAESLDNQCDTYNVININEDNNSYFTEQEIREQKNALTEAQKFVIKNLINHGDEAAKVIEKVSGKKVAKWFLKYQPGISKALTPLLDYADLPKDTVADAIYRGVINAGGTPQMASNVVSGTNKYAF